MAEDAKTFGSPCGLAPVDRSPEPKMALVDALRRCAELESEVSRLKESTGLTADIKDPEDFSLETFNFVSEEQLLDPRCRLKDPEDGDE